MSIRRDLLLRTALLRLPEPPPVRPAATTAATPPSTEAPAPRRTPAHPRRRPAKG